MLHTPEALPNKMNTYTKITLQRHCERSIFQRQVPTHSLDRHSEMAHADTTCLNILLYIRCVCADLPSAVLP